MAPSDLLVVSIAAPVMPLWPPLGLFWLPLASLWSPLLPLRCPCGLHWWCFGSLCRYLGSHWRRFGRFVVARCMKRSARSSLRYQTAAHKIVTQSLRAFHQTSKTTIEVETTNISEPRAHPSDFLAVSPGFGRLIASSHVDAFHLGVTRLWYPGSLSSTYFCFCLMC